MIFCTTARFTLYTKTLICTALILILSTNSHSQEPKPTEKNFTWPNGNISALSITFDDARPSQLTHGVPVLDKYGVKGTFYISFFMIDKHKNEKGWLAALRNGHELGNHSYYHPCSGNFTWTREYHVEIESYTLEKMKKELIDSNRKFKETFAITPTSFAYPCGHTQVGRGKTTQSYVPLVAEIFPNARLWMAEFQNDPAFTDIHQLASTPMDEKTFEELLPQIKTAQKEGRWFIVAGHEVDQGGKYSTSSKTIERLIQYAQDPKNKIWVDTVSNIAEYVKKNRGIQ